MIAPSQTVPASSLWGRLRSGGRVLRAEPDWDGFAGPGWADRVLTADIPDRFHTKQGRSIGRWTLTDGSRKLVVYLKRHYVLPRWRGLLAALFPGRAWSPGLEEWEHLAWARANGFPVPRAVAGGEYRGPWGRLQSFLAVEELPDMLPLHEAVPLARGRLLADEFARWKRGLVAELARLSRELHRRRMFHQDLYLCHFYVPVDDTGRVPTTWTGQVWMIDFHRLARHRLGRQWWQVKDLAQLLFSTAGVAGITVRDRARFWKLYRGGDWHESAPPPGWVKAAAAWKAGRYERHNLKQSAKAVG